VKPPPRGLPEAGTVTEEASALWWPVGLLHVYTFVNKPSQGVFRLLL
jgi:hypothetical protein